MAQDKRTVGSGREPLIVKALAPELDDPSVTKKAWLLHTLFNLIQDNRYDLAQVKDKPIQFGAHKIKPFSEVVFDFRKAADPYRLALKVLVQERPLGQNKWDAFFEAPRLIILPPTASYDRASETVEFRPCLAHGEKGDRVIRPFLKNISAHAFTVMQNQGQQNEQIQAMSECLLIRKGPALFDLVIDASGQACNRLPLFPKAI